MNIQLLNQNISDASTDISLVYLSTESLKKSKNKKALKMAGFTASGDSICFLHDKNLLVCGVDEFSADDIRSTTSVAIKALKKTNYKSANILIDDKALIPALVEGFVLGGYTYDRYKSTKTKTSLKNVSLIYTKDDYKQAIKIFTDAVIIADATAFTRDIVNTIPEDLNPPTFADLAKKLAQENNLDCKILGEKELAKEKMNAMLAVGRASRHDSKLIHLTYKPKNPKKVVTLVGKGLTYDSGGLSLKPGTSMVTMKMDKAGGCAVLGMIKAISELKLNIEVHAFIGAVENMIGGDAYKPDDVLVSRSGKTIEVRNTDAEGRLVLADVLDYAQDSVKADYMFDFATLTGACMVALGQYTTGVMGHSSALKHEISKASSTSGELTASLPFNKHLKKQIKSEIADICNISNKPYGGAITAGLFLDAFVREENKKKWLHFDIAGSAYTESPWDCNVYGGTGAGVRFISKFLQGVI
ncbi:leucyl aminopeptidase [Sulfurimonas sp.]|jgi:leucyl aminopeptidase|uniref:leucyl aminopeptidase n=1 Tax=Sulfurimonas sp. TaxID=2022749 RepID=UPI0025E0FD53|nr:leucyl aminopeptidase [Sulfurimonas sp.]MBT5934026.1 leucyl aminopeptidase [Sulfurimonas sp.]